MTGGRVFGVGDLRTFVFRDVAGRCDRELDNRTLPRFIIDLQTLNSGTLISLNLPTRSGSEFPAKRAKIQALPEEGAPEERSADEESGYHGKQGKCEIETAKAETINGDAVGTGGVDGNGQEDSVGRKWRMKVQGER